MRGERCLCSGLALSKGVRRLVGYFGFRDWVDLWLSFISTIFPPESKRMVLARQGVKKQYGNRSGSGAWALAMLKDWVFSIS